MLSVLPVPCLHDNYAYLLTLPGRGSSGGDAAVVDACEAAPVLAALAVGAHRLQAVLSTHHHHDHVGGNEAVHARFAGAPVYAYIDDFPDGKPTRVPAQTVGLADGQEFQVLGRRVQALHIPAHTLTALAYYFPDDGLLFTGDTLFNAGCGRLFEGTPAQMHASLQRLAALPPMVRVYCGHEYTQKNLTFASAVEPDSAAIRTRSQQVAERRAAHEPTVPATLKEELQTNPFLRVAEPAVRAAAARRPAVAGPIRDDDDVEVLARLRRWRDEF
jgi:hydroxyacylglutathione hydrolase